MVGLLQRKDSREVTSSYSGYTAFSTTEITAAPSNEQRIQNVPRMSPNKDAEANLDIVQFAAPNWFVHEDEGTVTIHVMRIGRLSGSCSVGYRTCDGSAEEGVKYLAASGVLDFKHGQESAEFLVTVIGSPAFDTTLSFNVFLENPQSCRLEPRLQEAPVYILDDDCFPSDKYEEQIKGGNQEELDLVATGLLIEFAKYCLMHVPSIWWKSMLTLVLDQLSNAYYVMSLFMRVYLIDVILNVKDESTNERLIVPGERGLSALMLAVAWFTPNVILLGIDIYVSRGLDMGFAIRKYLRVNLFRKMLFYNDESRQKVPLHNLTEALGGTIPDVTAHGYLGLFEVLKDLGKVACVAFFLILHHPSSVLGLIVFPAAILTSLKCRQTRSLQLQAQAADAQGVGEGLVAAAAQGIEIIENYNQKIQMVQEYEKDIKDQRELTMELKMFEFWSDQLVPWLAVFATTAYMIFGSFQVLEGTSTVGTLLATLNVYKDLGDRFGGVYRRLNDAKNAAEPLMGLIEMLNLSSAVGETKAMCDKRLEYAMTARKQSAQTNWNSLPIVFSNVSVKHVPQIQNFNISVKQGSIVLIHGPQGFGKGHLLNLITDDHRNGAKLEDALDGDVLYPPHLSCLHVEYSPAILLWLGLLDNLRFGANPALQDPVRVRKMFGKTGIQPDHWLMKRLDMDIGGESDPSKVPWYMRASHAENKLIHLTRAFVFDPEIMVMHKPVDDLDKEKRAAVLGMLSDFVNQGKLEGKMRTVFLSTGSADIARTLRGWCDYYVELSGTTPYIESPDPGGGTTKHMELMRGDEEKPSDTTQDTTPWGLRLNC